MIIGARMIFSRGEQIRASEGRKSPSGSKGGAPVGTGGDAPIIWQDVLKIMHKYIVYWDVGQHLLVPNAQKNTLQHFQVGASASLPTLRAHWWCQSTVAGYQKSKIRLFKLVVQVLTQKK